MRTLAVDGSNFYALLDPGGVVRSSDDGQTWQAVGVIANDQFPSRTFSLAIESAKIFVGSADGV